MKHTYRCFVPKGYKGFCGCPIMPGGEGCRKI